MSESGATAVLPVPGGGDAGPLPIRWRVALRATTGNGVGDQNGVIGFTALPRDPGITVIFSPDTARPGDEVTVSFAVDGDATIEGCVAQFDGGQQQNCRRSGTGWIAVLRVPDGAQPGATTIRWAVAYRFTDGSGHGDANGTTAFTIPRANETTGQPPDTAEPSTPGGNIEGADNPPNSRPNPLPRADTSPLGFTLLVVIALLAVGGLIALVRRGSRAGTPVLSRSRPRVGTTGHQVRAVARAGAAVKVSVYEASPAGTHVMRLEPRPAIVAVDIQEAR